MTVRRPGTTALPAFSSVVVCSRKIPTGASNVTILGRRIPAALPTTINRIALISDTGCSVNPLVVQDCASSTAWPLRANAERIASENPDVILDAGDYIYRESACPPADTRTRGRCSRQR
ncbi:MAG: hypothetical protein NTX29_11390, partial [Actinobacteria bacterium]|nr:hypothetical protein [Actinomycetota bacterium]